MNINSYPTANYKKNDISFQSNPVKKPSTFISLSARAALGAKKVGDKYNSFCESMAGRVIAPLMNSNKVQWLADKTSKRENITGEMQTVGSFITTSAYAVSTLNNDKLEKKPARTLALNQVLVTVLSTIGAFTIDGALANASKKLGYKFSDANQGLGTTKLATRMKGFKSVQKLLTFTLMYRYVAPVIVTPAASLIGKALNSDKMVKTQSEPATRRKSA